VLEGTTDPPRNTEETDEPVIRNINEENDVLKKKFQVSFEEIGERYLVSKVKLQQATEEEVEKIKFKE